MKILLALAFILTTLSLGCDKDKKDAPAPGTAFGSEIELTGNIKDLPDGTYEEYLEDSGRFKDGGCTTGPRLSLNLEQLCRQLQSDWTNNNCVPHKRKRIFRSDCADKTWNPEAIEMEIQETPGAHVTCFASDPSEDGLKKKKNNPERFENDEHFIDRVSALKYNDFIAFIFMDLKDGLFRVKIRAFDESSGRLIAETQKSWKDQMPDEVTLESLPERVRVTCTPTIR